MNLWRTFLATILLFPLLFNPGVQGAGGQIFDHPSGEFIAIRGLSAGAAAELAGRQLPIYGHVYTAAGEILLTQASAEQQAQLKSQAFNVQVLDKNFAAAPGYFLVLTRQAADLERIIAQPPPGVTLIAVFDARQGLARSTPIAAEQLLRYGAQLQALIPSAPINAQVPGALPSVVVPQPAVQDMLDDVTASSLTALVADLSGEQAAQIGGSPYLITTRYSRTTTPIEKATQYAYEHLAALGLDVAYHSYELPGTGIRRNVIGEQAGLSQPERIFVLSAHIDSTSGSPNTLAPGADDNASGTAGVLAAAEILSQYSFGCTLRYALFSGEEQGLYGSQAYANDIAAAGNDVEAVLNLDMVAFNSDAQPIIDLYTRPGNTSDLAIANLMADVASAYNLNLIPDIIQNGENRSDHASFWSAGYPAILAIEDFSDFTPDYHTTNDTLDTLDMAYFTEFVRAALGSMAHMGCGLGTLSGQVQILDTGAALSGATIRATATSGQKFVANSQPDGHFEMFLPAGVYDVAITAAGYSPFLVEDLAITNFVTTNLTAALESCLPPESLSILYAPALPQAGEPLVFSATITGGYPPPLFSWQFGDGAQAAGEVVSHTYAISGEYPVDLSAQACGSEMSTGLTVDVSGTPQIAISAQTFSVTLPTGRSGQQSFWLTNPGTAPLSWSVVESPPVNWLASDLGAYVLPPSGSSRYKFDLLAPETPGVYSTTLRIINDSPTGDLEAQVALNANCQAPAEASFSFTPANPLPGELVSFQAADAGGSLPAVYLWDFGAGDQAGGAAPSYAYPASGEFTTTLRVENCGGSVETQQVISVAQTCEAIQSIDLAYSPAQPTGGEPVEFIAAPTGGNGLFTYTWNFGDTTPILQANNLATVSHIFPASSSPQMFTVQLSVKNACSQPAPATIALTVWPRMVFLPAISVDRP